ncbi:MAG: hypothetical protein WBA93_25895, partial [Microcoleaceae cyanobacterium]
VSDNAYEESNDTLWRATPTGLTQKNHGIFSYFGEIGDNTNLLQEDDVDLFKFDLGLGERVRIPKNIELFDENDNFPFTNAEVKLYDETGQEFPATFNFLFTDTDNYEIYEANQAGTFYVGISSESNNSYNPNIEGSGSGFAAGNYGLTIETIGREMGKSNGGVRVSDAEHYRLFAVKSDNFGSSQIVELNPLTGEEINSFSAPEAFSPGPQGLAFDGNSLFFLTSNGPTTLWELDPDTGAVRDSDSISNFAGYDGLAALDGKLYILDNSNISNSDIIEFDPISDTVTNTLDIDGINGVSVEEGLAAITGPNALLATSSNSQLLEINPTTGEVTNSFFIPGLTEGVAVVDNEIYVGYYNNGSSEIEVFDRSGTSQRMIDLPYSVSALGGDDVDAIQFEEPNDTLLRATHTGLTLTNPGTFQYFGEIGDNTNLLPKDDVDLFKFDLDAGETVSLPSDIEIFDDNGSSVGNAEIKLFNSQGNPISFDSQNSESQIYQAQETGTFYIGISSGGNTNYNPNEEGSGNAGSTPGNYNLTIETTGSRTGDEPNDIRAEAIDTGLNLTNSGIFNYSGEIGDNVNVLSENDVDLFKFDLDVGEEVKFNSEIPLMDENGFGTPGQVKLFDADGLELTLPDDPDGINFGDKIYRAENGPETLYIGVSGSGTFYDPSMDTGGSGGFSDQVGSYDLTIETTGEQAMSIFSEDFNNFTGNGFVSTPAVGQLDSDIWKVTGLSDGNGTFGGTHDSDDFARGSSTGGVSTGGIYAFDVGSNNILGVQPGGSDFTPGDIVLKITNTTGSTITDLDIAYDIFYNNNEERANSLNFAWSVDDLSYTDVS